MVRQMVRNAYNRLKKPKFLTVRTTVRLGETRDSLLAPCQGINKVCQEVLADRHMIFRQKSHPEGPFPSLFAFSQFPSRGGK